MLGCTEVSMAPMKAQIHLYENPLGKSLIMYFWLILSVSFIVELISETGLKNLFSFARFTFCPYHLLLSP